MFALIWPVVLAVLGSTMYQICAKETAEDIQPFASLAITYSVATLLSAVLFFLLGGQANIILEFQKTNWTSWALGLTILFMELSYIFMYRVGWKISMASLVSNICGSVLLLFIGIFLYGDSLSPIQMGGILICIVGLILVNLPAKESEGPPVE